MPNLHQTIQLFLKKALAPEKIWLEKSFPTINRIADVVWPAQNILFEVQCSPISIREVQARNHDYQQVGYHVIWILHDRHFNHYSLTPAERFLRSQTHYFTNINTLGHGDIYDQYAHVYFGKRIRRAARLPIILNRCLHVKQVPRHFPKERREWKYSFEGDLFQHPLQEKHPTPVHLYKSFIHSLLEKIN